MFVFGWPGGVRVHPDPRQLQGDGARASTPVVHRLAAARGAGDPGVRLPGYLLTGGGGPSAGAAQPHGPHGQHVRVVLRGC